MGISLATALVVVAPFFALGIASGHDFEFHAASWLDVVGQWKEGIIFPRWAEWANHGFGEPRFIFYPPLSWLLGAALGSMLPWNAVPAVFIVLVQTLAGLCAFALTRSVTSRAGALFGAACYAANPYALLVIYMRSDFAEQLGMAFFPLLILFALRVAGVLRRTAKLPAGDLDLAARHRQGTALRQMRVDIALFSVTFGAIWLSNAPVGVMASYSAALLFAWSVLRQRSLWPGIRGFAGLALGFALVAFYLVPAAYEQRWVNIEQALASGLRPAENFLFTVINDPEHTWFNWIASSVAILLVAMSGVAALAARRGLQGLKPLGSYGGNVAAEAATHKTEASMPGVGAAQVRMPVLLRGTEVWGAMLVLSAAGTVLMLRFTDIAWRVLPKLRFVQFPWRWMCLVAVCYTVFLACSFGRGARAWVLSILVASFCVGAAVVLVQNGWWDTEDLPTLQAAIQKQAGYDGTDEYDPAGDDHYDIAASSPPFQILFDEEQQRKLPDTRIVVKYCNAEDKELTVTSTEDVRIALRLLIYPAWRAEVNGSAVTPQRAEDVAQMILPLRAGTSEIRVHFARTTDRTIGGAISAAGLAVLAFLLLAGRHRGVASSDTMA
ncbi:MAG TPA: hypothetical protein VE545_01790 [Candidatus Dormibacteraeota bacterium]|nr:hypothetical protein [Candidatus Dormibacteraeota bacterium]